MQISGMFRLMCKDEVPVARTVNTKSGEMAVLNLKVVPYWTQDKYVSPWTNVPLWGNQAERYSGALTHNMPVYISGELNYAPYKKTVEGTEVDAFSPEITRVHDIRFMDNVEKGNVDSSSYSSDSSSADDFAANTKKVADDIPF